jgi:hypothetical protein
MNEQGAEQMTALEKFPIPYNKEVELLQVTYENGFPILRMRVREGKRFTTLDLDSATAELWGRKMVDWAQAHRTDAE